MANNLMQVYCKRCNAMVCFAKFYPSTGWYVAAGTEGIDGRLNEFFDKHDRACWKNDMEDAPMPTGKSRYGFRTEMDDDKLLTDYGEAKVVRPS